MKKVLGISLVALFAAVPMMASADPVAGSPTPYTEQPTGTARDAVVGGTPLYQLAQSATTDGNVVSAGYVKGAYNAAIKGVNKVHDEAVAAQSAADSANAAIAGLGSVYDAKGSASSAKSSIEGKLSSGATGYDIDAKSLKIQGAAVATQAYAKDGANLTDSTVTKAKLATAVQSSLNKADSALQSGDIASSLTSESTNAKAAGAKLVYDELAKKQNTISDLATIRSGAAAGATALQSTSALNGANLTDSTVTKAKLATAVQSSLNKADSALQSGDIASSLTSESTNAKAAGAKATYDAIATAKSGAISTAASDATTKANTAESNAKTYAAGLISSSLDSANNNKAAGTKATYDAIATAKSQAISAAQSGMATQSGVAATVNAATGSVSGVSLGVNFGTITTNTSALKVSVPTKASYNIMNTWGSDSATAGTYSLGTNSNTSVTGTATTTIAATTATGSISGIDVSVTGYTAE